MGLGAGTGNWGALEAENQGIANALIAQAEDWLRAQGMTRAVAPSTINPLHVASSAQAVPFTTTVVVTESALRLGAPARTAATARVYGVALPREKARTVAPWDAPLARAR